METEPTPPTDHDRERDSGREEAPDAPTRELALSELRDGGGAPAVRSDLRHFLPGVEPERRVTDWGRSELVEGLVDRTVYDFLYHRWFRVEVEGIENVPTEGGAMLVANHAGALPPDGMMIAKAIREEHRHPRPLHISIESALRSLPGVGMLITKVGGVPAHPANVHRLLFDEHQLVLVFPEGREGTDKPLKDRYRLRRFGRGEFVAAALRARVPIVPVAVLGTEEAQPVFAHLSLLRRLTRLPRLPITPTFPHLGPLGLMFYLPAKVRIRFLEPVELEDLGGEPWSDPAGIQTLAADIRALIQENLLEMVAARGSVWLG
ncbi:MAG TPA: lysophospholipid acyltransferase family protein [Solirubrobacteraceae bacterium]